MNNSEPIPEHRPLTIAFATPEYVTEEHYGVF